MSDDKLTDAEEIFSEFQKENMEKEKAAETPVEPNVPSDPTPEPTSEPTSEPEKDTSPKTQEHPIEASETTDNDKERIRDVIFVGTKPIMVYVTATLTQLSNQKTVTIKARGKRITQAVDVSQMIVKRMDSVGYVISDVRIASDSLTSQDGRQRNVSTIEIDVTKP